MMISLTYFLLLMVLTLSPVISANKNHEDHDNPFASQLGSKLYQWSASRENIMERNTTDVLKSANVVALYFSASWCGPCKQFTPQLVKFYNDMKKKGKKLEIVWVSRDQTEDEFIEYYRTMPWLAVTIDNISKCVEKTTSLYNVKGIPHLVILDGQDASTYTLDGRTKVLQDPYGLEFPWRPRTPGNLIKQFLPRSLRTIFGRQIANVKGKIFTLLRGFLQSFLPGSIIDRILER